MRLTVFRVTSENADSLEAALLGSAGSGPSTQLPVESESLVPPQPIASTASL
ncbi:hypothetical protein FRB95_003368, partial [Tulasnella sp. JGI-2019a]